MLVLATARDPAPGFGLEPRTRPGPRIEYNWSSRMGVLAGAIVTPASRNVAVSLTPVVAVNIVF